MAGVVKKGGAAAIKVLILVRPGLGEQIRPRLRQRAGTKETQGQDRNRCAKATCKAVSDVHDRVITGLGGWLQGWGREMSGWERESGARRQEQREKESGV